MHDFLVSIGVPSDVADADAEGMEHHISDYTLSLFKKAISE